MSRKIEVELNSDGSVQNKGIHDAAILETSVVGEGEDISAIVRCKSENGVEFVFRMEGVRLFTVNFFGQQNVILDCIMIKNKDAKESLSQIKDLEKYTFERFDVLNDLIKKGDLTLLQFIPAIGANIDCICKVVTLEAI